MQAVYDNTKANYMVNWNKQADLLAESPDCGKGLLGKLFDTETECDKLQPIMKKELNAMFKI